MINTEVNKSSPTNFQLVFPKVPTETTLSASDELTLNIYGSIIPGVTLNSNEQNWQGGTIQEPGKVTFEPWMVSYVVDSRFLNWKLLFKWLMYVNNNKDKYAELPSNFKVDASLRIIDNFNNNVLRVYYTNVWIQGITEVDFSYREGEVNLESTASFVYDRYEIKDDE